MLSKIFQTLILSFLLFHSMAIAENTGKENRAADEKAIREHIDKIFHAYMKKDRATVEATHSKNWRGFLTHSTKILRGLDDYMKEVDEQGSLDPKNPGHLTDYNFLDYDIVFHGDTAIVNYIAELFWESGENKGSYKLRSIDIYGKEDGEWNQIASNICALPEPSQ